MHRLTELGNRIRERWDVQGYPATDLPAIAADCLEQANLARTFDVGEFLRWFARQSELPPQSFANFSDFPLQVYQSDRFYLELLFWTTSTTSIHQHAFAGAFTVLAGSSVHAEWDFQLTERLHPELCVGALTQKKIELLAAGSTRLIPSGAALIHSLYHLDNPSVTLVARTPGLPSAQPQWDYCAPFGASGIAFCAQHDPVFERKRQCLIMLATSGSRELDRFLADALDSAEDAIQLSKLLVAASHLVPDGARLGPLFQRARARFGAVVDLLGAVVNESHRVALLEGARKIFIGAADALDGGIPFFFGLLMNVRSRRQLVELIARRYPGQPAAPLVARWVRAVRAVAPQAFGAPLDDDAIAVLERLVAGATLAEVGPPARWQPVVDAPAFRGLFWDARVAEAQRPAAPPPLSAAAAPPHP